MKQAHLRTIFFLALLTGVLVLVFSILKPYLVTLAIAGTAAILLHPIHVRLVKLFRGHNIPAALSMVILSYVLLLLPLTFLGIEIASEASSLYVRLTNDSGSFQFDFLGEVQNWIERYLPWLSVEVSQYAGQGLNWIAGNIQGFFAGTVRAAMLLGIGTIAYYYMLKDGKQFLKTIVELSPLTQKEDEELISRIHLAVNSVVRGSLIIAILQGALAGVGLAFFGVPSASLLGSLAGVGALIPAVGTSVVMAPVIIVKFITQDYVAAVSLLVWTALIVGSIDNILRPILVGKDMKMHPFFVFISVIGGIAYFGMSGFIMGPLIVSFLFGLLDIFRQETR